MLTSHYLIKYLTKWFDVLFAGSPFQFTVGPITDGGSHKVRAVGPGLERGEVNKPCKYDIYIYIYRYIIYVWILNLLMLKLLSCSPKHLCKEVIGDKLLILYVHIYEWILPFCEVFHKLFCEFLLIIYNYYHPGPFNIYTREAGAGGLSMAVEGPSKAEIDFQDKKDGSCEVAYTCTEPGQ